MTIRIFTISGKESQLSFQTKGNDPDIAGETLTGFKTLSALSMPDPGPVYNIVSDMVKLRTFI